VAGQVDERQEVCGAVRAAKSRGGGGGLERREDGGECLREKALPEDGTLGAVARAGKPRAAAVW
jgi:hypothetical protein